MAIVVEPPVVKTRPPKLPPGIHIETIDKILKALEARPYTVAELGKITGYAKDMNYEHVTYLTDFGFIKKVPSALTYVQLANHDYKFDFSADTPIEMIPEYLFTEIPLMKRWYDLMYHIPYHKQHINDFRNICYGKVVKTFKIHPEKWVYPKSNELFFRQYKTQKNKAFMPANIVKALRAFLEIAKEIRLQPKSQEARLYGLIVDTSKVGQYRYTKLTPQEMTNACKWLVSDECKAICKQLKIEHPRILAHFAFSVEGFGRPSRVLTIETEKIEKHRNVEKGRAELRWLQLETKQDREWGKMMWNSIFVKWGSEWMETRLMHNYKYLFIDDNTYLAQKHDSTKLRDERKKYTKIYKAMFKVIGKITDQDSIYKNDTLYALRHIGVKLWVDRLGMQAIPIISSMGWTKVDTPLQFYAGMEAVDVYTAISEGNFKGNDYDITI